MASVERTWACKCGEVQMKLIGEPHIVFNCWCTGCADASRYHDEKAQSGGDGNISAMCEHGPGVAKALYFLNNVSFVKGKDKLVSTKVGENGSNVRSYTSCCNTMHITSGGSTFPINCLRPFNRNCIKNSDGTPYIPEGSVLNANGVDNPEFDKAPDPKHNSGSWRLMFRFVKALTMPRLLYGGNAGEFKNDESPGFFTDPANVSEVITSTLKKK